jgi:hypothetical protein
MRNSPDSVMAIEMATMYLFFIIYIGEHQPCADGGSRYARWHRWAHFGFSATRLNPFFFP